MVREERFRAREAGKEAREAEKEQQGRQAQLQREQLEHQAQLQKEAEERQAQLQREAREHELQLAKLKADQGSANQSGQGIPVKPLQELQNQNYQDSMKSVMTWIFSSKDLKGLRRAKAGTEMNGQFAIVHY